MAESIYEKQGRALGKKVQGGIFNALMMPAQGMLAVRDLEERAKRDAAGFAGGLIGGLDPRPAQQPVRPVSVAMDDWANRNKGLPPAEPSIVNQPANPPATPPVNVAPAVAASTMASTPTRPMQAAPSPVPLMLVPPSVAAMDYTRFNANEASNDRTATRQDAEAAKAKAQADAIQAQRIAAITGRAAIIGGADAQGRLNQGSRMYGDAQDYGGAGQRAAIYDTITSGGTVTLDPRNSSLTVAQGQMFNKAYPGSVRYAPAVPTRTSEQAVRDGILRAPMDPTKAQALLSAPASRSPYASQADYLNRTAAKVVPQGSGLNEGMTFAEARRNVPTARQEQQSVFLKERRPGESFNQFGVRQENQEMARRAAEAQIGAINRMGQTPLIANPRTQAAQPDQSANILGEMNVYKDMLKDISLPPDERKAINARLMKLGDAMDKLRQPTEQAPAVTTTPAAPREFTREALVATAKKHGKTIEQVKRDLGIVEKDGKMYVA